MLRKNLLRITVKILSSAFLVILYAAVSSAQTIPVIGYVANETANPERLEILKKGLAELGYVDGKSIVIEHKTARLDSEYAAVVAELINRGVNIILAANAPAAVAARKATTTVPIVIAVVNDPVGLGLINSLERSGTNVSGTTNYAPHLIAERLHLLRRIVPTVGKIAMIINGNNANNQAQFSLLSEAARPLGIEAEQVDIRTPADTEGAFSQAEMRGAQGLFNGVDSFINSQRFAMAKLATQHKLPMIYTDREYVLAGGLMSIGVGHQEGFYGAAKYVDLILRGANPADLPVAATKSVDFSVSRAALDRSGLTLPKEVSERVNDWLN
jgi:putative tryptophan/tyrosine transport system substrate-binding protein